MMVNYYDVLIKKANKYKYKIRLDYPHSGWNNTEGIGKIVFSKQAKEWWFAPRKDAVLGAKELRVIAVRIDDLEKANETDPL